ncbi:MAG: InlB B-repeat-containing protein, partial [Clostridia bacterium]|nr:InlB B-repeat-containing protein [Clostridia bacterium]
MLTSRKSISVFIVAIIVIFCSLFLFACEKSDPSTVNTVPVMPDTTEGQQILFTVTFNSNGGSSVEAQSLPVGSLVQRPKDPTKDNYTFLGWYADSFLARK